MMALGVEINGYDTELLKIMPWDVLESIENADEKWEVAVPEVLVPLIKNKKLFNYARKNINVV